MALIECPQCGGKAWEAVEKCAHCGYSCKTHFSDKQMVDYEAKRNLINSVKFRVLGLMTFLPMYFVIIFNYEIYGIYALAIGILFLASIVITVISIIHIIRRKKPTAKDRKAARHELGFYACLYVIYVLVTLIAFDYLLKHGSVLRSLPYMLTAIVLMIYMAIPSKKNNI